MYEQETPFDARFPKLKRICNNSPRGRMELLEVNETSDGFLIGQAIIGEGNEAYFHSVFLGAAADYR